MAKKHRKSILKKIDIAVNILYKKGILQSLIIHLCIMLCMALLYPIAFEHKKIVLDLSFSKPEPDILIPQEAEPIKIVSWSKSEDPLSPSSELYDEESFSMIASSDDIPLLPIPETGETASEDILDNITSTELIKEIKENPTNKKRGKTQQVLMSRTGQAQSHNVANVDDQNIIGEIQHRLKVYGAKTGDVQISLSWDTIDDLDLYVLVEPINSSINWTNKMGICGGVLDVDMNANLAFLNPHPIENIFWAPDQTPKGTYVVGVHLFMNWSRAQLVRGTVLVKAAGKINAFPVSVRYGDPVTHVITFTHP